MHSITLSLTSALHGSGWSTPRPYKFSLEIDPVPIIRKDMWAAGPVWTGAENLAPTSIRCPQRPALCESLY
jgi:hypothetical protein